jgi:hypothetical protein
LLFDCGHSGFTCEEKCANNCGPPPVKPIHVLPPSKTKAECKKKPLPPAPPPPSGWMTVNNTNAVWGGDANDTQRFSISTTNDAASCEAACKKASPACKIWTWHDENQGEFAKQCWQRLDGVWQPRAQGGHTSGYDSAFVKPPTTTG